MTNDDDIEAPHAASATEHVLTELQLFGYRPFDDEPDPRPLPEGRIIAGAVADIFDALVATLSNTRLEPALRAYGLLVGAVARGAFEARVRELIERSDPIFV